MSVLTPVRDRHEAARPIEADAPHRGRHPEAPDQGDLDPRRVEAAEITSSQEVEAPDAGDADLDHGRSQS